MSVARPVFKKIPLMLTRRVRGRTFLLRPCPRTNQIIGYVVAVMAKKWNVTIHAIEVLSNHWHVVFTDHEGQVVDFARDCHSFIARGLNVHFGDEENVWSCHQTSLVRAAQPIDLLKEMVYTVTNVVEAGLVPCSNQWPGIALCWPCKPQTFKRPPKFFRGEDDGGKWPEEATLELGRPPGFDDLSDAQLANLLETAIRHREQHFRDKYAAEGREFLGAKAILEQSRYDSPNTVAPRFKISPRVKCADKQHRIECLESDKRWRVGYYESLAHYRAGDRDAIFPAGTYKMRVLHNVRCADAPT